MSSWFGSLFGSSAASPNKVTLSSGAMAGKNSKSVTNLEKGAPTAAAASPYNAHVNVAPEPIQVVTQGGHRRRRRRLQTQRNQKTQQRQQRQRQKKLSRRH